MKRSCDICYGTFSSTYTLKRHKKNVHGPRIECQYCGLLLRAHGRPDSITKHHKTCYMYRRHLNVGSSNEGSKEY